MAKQRGAFMRGLNQMVIEEIDIPEVSGRNVLVGLEYVGICGSDVHYFHTGKCGAYEVDLSEKYMLGHECAGTVVAVGDAVTSLRVGDKVALEPGIPCGTCEFCKSGKYNLCPDVVFLATPPVPGCNEEFIAFPEEMCFRLPDHVSTKEGALIEPLSVGFHAANQGDVQVGETVVILGCGCIGLVTMLSCRAHGAATVIMADCIDAKLAKARELGASYVIDIREKDTLEEVARLTNGRGADRVFDCAGSIQSIAQTPKLVARGGTIVQVAMNPQEEIAFNFAQMMDKEATLKTVFRYRNIYEKAIAAVASGAIDVKGIVTHEYDLDHIQEAYEEALNNKTDLVKAVIKIR